MRYLRRDDEGPVPNVRARRSLDDPFDTHIARTSPEYDDGGARAMWDFSINTTYTPYSDAIDAVEISRVGR